MTLMTHEIQDQMSAFWDDELSAEECAFLVRRLEHDPDARGKLSRYATIGCALRGELLQPDPAILRRRLEEALTGTTVPVRKAASASVIGPRALRPALGFGIAATVAVVAVFGLRGMYAGGPEAGTGSLQAGQATPDAPPAYVVPRDVAEQRAVAAPIRLTNYLMHHGEYASPLYRQSVHFSVVGGRDNPADELQPVAAEEAVPPEGAVRD
jgi:negative regulator of sigma E activity